MVGDLVLKPGVPGVRGVEGVRGVVGVEGSEAIVSVRSNEHQEGTIDVVLNVAVICTVRRIRFSVSGYSASAIDLL